MSNLRVSCYKIFMLLFVALSVFYSCTADEDILLEAINQNNSKETNSIESIVEETTITDSESSVEADKSITLPMAVATPTIGKAPLEVTFTVGDAFVGKTFAKYEWKFKDGTKSTASKAVHTFKEVGKHDVELTATDDQGVVVNDTVTVTVIEPVNEAPNAVVSADIVSGESPLEVAFTGGGSTDDGGITSYSWDFGDGSLSLGSNVTHTFVGPGVYAVSLTVADDGGLKDTAVVTVTVSEAATASSSPGQIPCSTGGGMADDTGAKIWCWGDISIPDYTGQGVALSNR
uniref:PKD domain-containing protein n=1 Tax=Pareuzebyella sediminis TaxID=2607998 RepID=UPI0011EBB249